MKGNLARAFYIALGAVLITSEGMNYSMIAPFFPIEARHKGTSDAMIGLVIGSFSLTSCISSIILSKFVSSKLQFFFVIGGCIIAGVCLICLGLLEFASPGPSFYIMSMLCRMLNGFASAMMWSTAYPAMCSINEKWTAFLAPLLEFSAGFGVIIGPPIGSFLYSSWGYATPFYVIGAFQIILSLYFLSITFSFACSCKAGDTVNNTISVKILYKLAKNYRMVLISFPFILSTTMVGLIDTVLAPYLVNVLQMSTNLEGLVFAIQATFFAIANICNFPLPNLGYSGILYAIGPALTALGGLAFCLQAYITALQSFPYVCFCLSLISFGSSAVIMNCYLVYDKVTLHMEIATGENVKLVSASWVNILFSSGGTFGATFFGGVFYHRFGIFPAFFTLSLVAVFSFTINVFLLHSLGLLQKIYFGTPSSNEVIVPLLGSTKFPENS